MRPVSRAWQRTIVGSHTPITRITLCEDYQTGTSPTGPRLDLIDGSVHLDGDADLYTTAQLAFPGEAWPQLTPAGAEVYVQTGIRYSDDLIELVGLGYLRIRTPSQPAAHLDGVVTVQAEDRNSTLARADLLEPRLYPATTTYGEMAEDLVLDVYPEATIEWDDDHDTYEIGRDIVVDQYRLQALQALAVAAGKVARWDHRGVLVFRTPFGLLEGEPVARLAYGRGGVLVGAGREISDEEVVNAVAVRGDGAGPDLPAVYGIVYDTDPTSPTRYGGRFGPAPRIITNSLITTQAQALTAARADLARHAGLLQAVSFESSPRPELEPDDLVHIEHAQQGGRHLLAALDIPLVPGRTMTGTSRQQAVTAGGVL